MQNLTVGEKLRILMKRENIKQVDIAERKLFLENPQLMCSTKAIRWEEK